MTAFKKRLVNGFIRRVFRVAFRVDDRELAKVPAQGPLIIVSNHINTVDAPVMITHMQPRPVTGLAKVETWDNPFLAYLFNLWEIIPIERGTADLTAINKACEALAQNKMVVVAPEGTRSRDGKLLQGKPGVLMLSLRTGAPLLPVAFYGNENFSHNIRRLRRTDFNIRVGEPFIVRTDGVGRDRDTRQQVTDQIMCRIAALLPEEYRGYYTEMVDAPQPYLEPVALGQKMAV